MEHKQIMKLKKFVKFWKEAINYQIEKPKNKTFYFLLGFVVAHLFYNVLNLVRLNL